MAVVLSQGRFCLPGTFGNVGRHSWLSQPAVVGGATGIWGVGARNTAEHPASPGSLHKQRMIQPQISVVGRPRNLVLLDSMLTALRSSALSLFSPGYWRNGGYHILCKNLLPLFLNPWNPFCFHCLGPATRYILWEETRGALQVFENFNSRSAS